MRIAKINFNETTTVEDIKVALTPFNVEFPNNYKISSAFTYRDFAIKFIVEYGMVKLSKCSSVTSFKRTVSTSYFPTGLFTIDFDKLDKVLNTMEEKRRDGRALKSSAMFKMQLFESYAMAKLSEYSDFINATYTKPFPRRHVINLVFGPYNGKIIVNVESLQATVEQDYDDYKIDFLIGLDPDVVVSNIPFKLFVERIPKIGKFILDCKQQQTDLVNNKRLLAETFSRDSLLLKQKYESELKQLSGPLCDMHGRFTILNGIFNPKLN